MTSIYPRTVTPERRGRERRNEGREPKAVRRGTEGNDINVKEGRETEEET
jgi:hypothetical protein